GHPARDLQPVPGSGQAVVTPADNASPPLLGPAGWHRQLTTLERWRQFTVDTPDVPELLPGGVRDSLSGNDRSCYDERRLDYHTRLGVVATSTLRHVVNTGRRLTLLNR